MIDSLPIILPKEPICAASETMDFDGQRIPTTETNDRMEALVRGFGRNPKCIFSEAWGTIGDVARAASLQHDPAYLAALKRYGEVLEPGTCRLAEELTAPGLIPETMISNNSYRAAIASAAAALAAADSILQHRYQAAVAACRPPGHHAGRKWCGGYCYLNNAAIAYGHLAGSMKSQGAIIDLDYHYANGTADIMREAGDCFFASLHCSTLKTFPFVLVADEISRQTYLTSFDNLPSETEFLGHLATLIICAERFGAKFAVISIGFDILRGDPFGGWEFDASIFRQIGKCLRSSSMKLCIVFEGGYHLANIEAGSFELSLGLLEN